MYSLTDYTYRNISLGYIFSFKSLNIFLQLQWIMKFLRFLQNPQPRSLAWAATTSSKRPRTTSTPPTSLHRPLATTTSRSTWRRWARPGPQLRRPDSAGQLLPLWTSTSTPPNRATLKNRATFFWSRTSWVSPELRLFRVKNPSALSCKVIRWGPCEFWGLIIWEVDIFVEIYHSCKLLYV